MGNWAMHIEGHGVHDNGPNGTSDADKLLAEFAERLQAAGHMVHLVSFTSGATKVKLPGIQAPAPDWQYRP